MPVRLSQDKDLQRLADVERSAATALVNYFDGDTSYAERTLAHDILIQAHENKTLWIAVEQEKPIGFLAATPLDDALHIQEISVEFGCQGKGFGRDLINAVIAETRIREYSGISLTTNRIIPWNGPFYERIGFKEVQLEDCPNGLHDLLLKEKTHHPAPDDRIAMMLAI